MRSGVDLTSLAQHALTGEAFDDIRANAGIAKQIAEAGVLDLQVSKGSTLQFSLPTSDMALLQPSFQVSEVFLPSGSTPALVIPDAFLFGFGSAGSRARASVGRHDCPQSTCRLSVPGCFIRRRRATK